MPHVASGITVDSNGVGHSLWTDVRLDAFDPLAGGADQVASTGPTAGINRGPALVLLAAALAYAVVARGFARYSLAGHGGDAGARGRGHRRRLEGPLPSAPTAEPLDPVGTVAWVSAFLALALRELTNLLLQPTAHHRLPGARQGSRVPSLSRVFGRVIRTKSGRVGVTVGWAWLGLPFFAR